jgi:hypothetical protein
LTKVSLTHFSLPVMVPEEMEQETEQVPEQVLGEMEQVPKAMD